jgi:thioredoxin family protein
MPQTPVTRERFEQGITYDEFKAQMTRNQERFTANESALVLDPAAVGVFERLPRPLNVLVLAEDWCGDVIDNLPILGRLAAESGKLNLRVFLRDQHPDLMDNYLNHGEFRSIPVFVFFDDDFREIGRFIERPESVTKRRAGQRSDLSAHYPELGDPTTPVGQLPEAARVRLMELLAEVRAQTKPLDNQEVVGALREIVERAA